MRLSVYLAGTNGLRSSLHPVNFSTMGSKLAIAIAGIGWSGRMLRMSA
ncbi:hypothetical protein QT972_10185 [Microcoleus sp. herbarium7]